MAESPIGLRGFVDDARRLGFVIGLLIAVWAGTYWGWWAYVWDIAPPIRVVGVLGVTATVFTVWYGLIFSSHYYFGKPVKNPFVEPTADDLTLSRALRLRTYGDFDGNTFTISVANEGASDTFAAQVKSVFPDSQTTFPLSLRWKDSQQETREIVKGHTQYLQLVRITHNKSPESRPDRFTIGSLLLLRPTLEQPLSIGWRGGVVIFDLGFEISSTTTGASNAYRAHIFVACDGSAAPTLHGVMHGN